MDPTSQPGSQVNTNCPSSLTTPTVCMSSDFYKANCVAYCEQYLWWFYGPEVSFPNSQCQPNVTCTFAGAQSLAITNSYTFEGGVTGKSDEVLESAFNFGASYTYSKTTTTTQTLTSARPNSTIEYCGYWTFLPYYVRSCGFFLSKEVFSFTGGTPPSSYNYCGGHQNTTFTCNNSTLLDSNGNAEGITSFVATYCDMEDLEIGLAHSNNERLPMDQQDPRYSIPALPPSGFDQIQFAIDQSEIDRSGYPSRPASYDPTITEFCRRYCFCNYLKQMVFIASLQDLPSGDDTLNSTIGVPSVLDLYEITSLSDGCNCATLIDKQVSDNPSECSGDPSVCGIAITRDNASLFEAIAPANWSALSEGRRFWVTDNTSFRQPYSNGSDKYSTMSQLPFECFGEPMAYENVGHTFDNYTGLVYPNNLTAPE
ncbi:MAG: hypothetical protein M1836_000858 [Candelina mexicana]|nr:MAG: hypothetical protein M1836_000858 [Candelina mexicana]